MKIYYHPRFKISYRKLPHEIQIKAEHRERMFRKNPFNALLKTHKLHGALKTYWSFSVNSAYRILFQFHDSDIIFLDIGDHRLYK